MTKKPSNNNQATFAEALTQSVATTRPRGREPHKLIRVYKHLNQSDEWGLFVHVCQDKTVSSSAIAKALALMGLKVSKPTVARWRQMMRKGIIQASAMPEEV